MEMSEDVEHVGLIFTREITTIMNGDGHSYILDIFDDFDLEEPKERRLAVYALNDYYGAVLSEIVDNYFDFRDRDLEMGIKHQWNKAKSRLDELESVEIPDEYDTAIESVHEIRNDIAHDLLNNAPIKILETSRRAAPEWTEWISEVAQDYEEYQESLTATEALVQVGRRRLEYIKGSPQDYSFGLGRQQELLNADANQLRKELEDLAEEEEVSRELVDVISDIMELEDDKESLENEHRRRKKKAQREEQIRRAENTRKVIVTEGVNDFGEIVVVTHEVGKPDETYVLNIHHPKTPENVREKLRELKPNDEARLRIKEKVTRDPRGRIETESYVAEIK